jgi:signal transduction histidine kinase
MVILATLLLVQNRLGLKKHKPYNAYRISWKFMLDIITLVVTSLLNLLLGLVVYLKNPRGVSHRLFFGLTMAFVLWSTVNYISTHPVIFAQIIWVRLVLLCGALLNLSVFLTFLAFPLPSMPPKHRKVIRWGISSTAVVMLLTLTPLVFRTLKVNNGHASPVPAPGIAVLLIQTLVLIGIGLTTLIKRYKLAHGRSRDQLRLVLIGLIGSLSLIVVADFLLVVIFNFTALIPFGSAFTLIFSSSFAYAIIKHRLFDIRRAAARGLGYTLTTATLAGLYSLIIFSASSLFVHNRQLSIGVQSSYTVVALVLAFTFQPIKRFFDRITDRFFFKDNYQPQEFVDRLNRVLVTHVELQPLIANSITIVTEFLKADSCTFVIRETAYSAQRIISNKAFKMDKKQIAHLRSELLHSHKKVIVADLIEEQLPEIAHEMNRHDITVVVRLVPSLDMQAESVGDIIMGPKRSGNAYTKQDLEMLEIIANELVIAIQNAIRFEEIENFNETLQARIADATRKLRRTNDKLKELDETKDDFISMASHQLRTPLTSIKGYISMVLEEDAGPVTPLQHEMLGQAFFSSQRMVYLIADLLNVSRLKNGKFIIDTVPVNLADVVDQEMAQLKETAASRQLTLTYEKPDNFPSLMLDETKTRQVIMNFADNAIYYTPSGGAIKVVLSETQHSVDLQIVDDGIGVPKSEQPHLFTKFYRAGNARQARPDGTGLGLFMAKKIIVAQGGSLIFDSKEGQGSTFGFSFSKTRLAVPVMPAQTPTEIAVKVPIATPVNKQKVKKPLKAIAK